MKDDTLAISLRAFLAGMQEFGVFVVPNGELESWQPVAGLTRSSNKKGWLMAAFAAMGDDPDAQNYASPTNGDVWDFVGRISGWINNPARSGV